jgi:hypothetical protein
MIELRWLVNNDNSRRLQYRQKYDVTVRAGMWSNEDIVRTANYQWADWQDVPEAVETPTLSTNRCSKCGLFLEGTMSYVCIQPNCPTGLGGSMS